MQTMYRRLGPIAAAVSNGIALSQTVSTAGPVLLDGTLTTNGVAQLDTLRFVIITSTGNDSGITFTVTGTNLTNAIVVDTITGANAGVAATSAGFYTVTSIVASGPTAGAITAGTNSSAITSPLSLDQFADPQTAIQVTVFGTISYTVQQVVGSVTQLDYLSPETAIGDLVYLDHPDPNLVNATTTVQGNYAYIPSLMRVVLNSGSGSLLLAVTQSGNAPR